MSAIGFSTLTSGGIELDASPERFGFFCDSSDLLGDPPGLRARMDRDGYLFLPGFLDRDAIDKARHAICETLSTEGLLDPDQPVDLAVAKSDANMAFRPDIANGHGAGRLMRDVIYGEKMMRFFDAFLGGDATHYDFTWMRTVAPGNGSPPHCDVVFMGRGSQNLYTAWVPFNDVPLEMGGLLLLEGSHKHEDTRKNYCALDVDTACQNRPNESQLNAAGYPGFGVLNYDMRDTRDTVGGRLLTCENYRMGDLLIFSVFTVHGSLDNRTNRIRLSTDSRYQLASEPLDERWIGENPPAHGGSSVKGMIC